MANFVYDFLYSLPDSFNSFGDILERYIRVRIEECGFNPVLDKTWKKILKKSISAPDFTLSEENATIFIEVKRKHLPEIPKIIQSNDSFSRHLDDSIVKGVIQIYSLANELVNQKPNQINNFENFFGIVVTYKDDYLRGGQQFWDEFLRDQVTARLKDKDIDPYIIPPENIFVLPVDDIDYLLAFILDYPDKKISEVLKQVIEYEADVNRSSFFFRDHLSRMSKSGLSRPNHLWNKTKNMMDELTQKMQNFENNHRK